MTAIDEFFKKIVENEVKFVDFRFTDTKGAWHHITFEVETINQNIFKNGVFFDGSSIAGWRNINNSDMILMPDAKTFCMDPFTPYKTAILFCNIVNPNDLKNYIKDPRSIASNAENFLIETGIGNTAYFGPELEFFIFDDVKYHNRDYSCSFAVDSEEHPINSDRSYEAGNLGHRPKNKGGYFPVPPIDSAFDIRSEIMEVMKEIGLTPLQHHHEVAPSQHEVGFQYGTLIETADNVQKCKFVTHNVARSFGKTATFMPKPIFNDNGSGMHVHQSIAKSGKNIFVGTEYGGLSKEALFYIGGIMKHAKALNAFTNASTNSYKRLVPGYEAPTILSYSNMNRSASIRIPYVAVTKAKRIEVRFPDPTANPYLAFAAMLMAGIDGIINKIYPGDADERDLYNLSNKELAKKKTVAASLEEALNALNKDREFLLKGNVFSNEQIDAYIQMKRKDIEDLNSRPHPIEYRNYYSC